MVTMLYVLPDGTAHSRNPETTTCDNHVFPETDKAQEAMIGFEEGKDEPEYDLYSD